jgi:acetyltransferase-like isoleucine patch superfamily enzyme
MPIIMKRKLKLKLEKWFSNFLPFQIVMGGYRYFRATQENLYKPEEFLYYGKNIKIEAGVEITGAERMYISDDVGISACQINAMGGLHLGRCCQIAAGSVIMTIDHQITGGEALPYDRVRLIKPIYMEDYVWIGSRVMIAPGVRIGEGAVVAMGSVLFHDVPPLAVVSGNPAKVLMYRSKEDFERLKQAGSMIDPFKEMRLLKVPPATKRKYKNELRDFRIDLSHGEYFHYDRFRPSTERLAPVNPGATNNAAPK